MRFGPVSNHYGVVVTEFSDGVGRSELMLHARKKEGGRQEQIDSASLLLSCAIRKEARNAPT